MKLCMLSSLIFLIFPHSLWAQEQEAIRNHYELYYGLDERLARGDTTEKLRITQGNSKITKDKMFGLTLYSEAGISLISTDPMDQFDPRGRELRQISAERTTFADSKEHPVLARFYVSGNEGAGYKITERLTINAKSLTGASIGFRF